MKTKELNFINNLANDRIREKEAILYNNKLILDYMNKNNINMIGNTTKDELIQQIKKLEEYIKVAKGGK